MNWDEINTKLGVTIMEQAELQELKGKIIDSVIDGFLGPDEIEYLIKTIPHHDISSQSLINSCIEIYNNQIYLNFQADLKLYNFLRYVIYYDNVPLIQDNLSKENKENNAETNLDFINNESPSV